MRFRIFHLLPLLFGIARLSDVLHTIHEGNQGQCHILPDIVDDNKYELYNEFLSCQLKHSEKCQPYLDVWGDFSYECKTFAKQLFFNKDFDAIGYAYSQSKDQLMSFLIDNIAVFSLDDPDFLNYFVFSQFFNSKIFQKILDTFSRSRKSIIDPHTQILQLLQQQLLFKEQSENTQDKKIETIEALRMTKCEFLKQQVNLYYVLAFSVNGKFEFDSYFQQMVGINKTTLIVDPFIQFMNGNAFVYIGAEEIKMKEEMDHDEIKMIQPRMSLITMDDKKIEKLAQGIRDTLMDEKLKERMSLELLTKKFQQGFDFTTINIFPIQFGSDSFPAFTQILSELGANQCGLLEVQRFRERVKKYVVFMDEVQKISFLTMIDEFLETGEVLKNEQSQNGNQQEVKGKEDL